MKQSNPAKKRLSLQDLHLFKSDSNFQKNSYVETVCSIHMELKLPKKIHKIKETATQRNHNKNAPFEPTLNKTEKSLLRSKLWDCMSSKIYL